LVWSCRLRDPRDRADPSNSFSTTRWSAPRRSRSRWRRACSPTSAALSSPPTGRPSRRALPPR